MNTVYFIIMIFSFGMLFLVALTPYLFALMAALRGERMSAKGSTVERVTVILPLFNEADYIIPKMDNIRDAVSHTQTPCEVLLGSDGSTDKTVEVVEQYIRQHNLKDWRIRAFPNEGKGQTLSKLVKESQGDLIISTDADVRMDKDAIALAVSLFEQDAKLGCLSSVPTFALKSMRTQSLYWKEEMKVREAESRMGKLIVVTGWLYAYRKAVYRDIPATAMADDLWVPLTVLLQGYRVIHHAAFKAYSEETDEQTEIARRKRVISGGADIVRRLFGDLLKHPALFMTVFLHKINRWLLPVWFLLLVVSSLIYKPVWMWVYLGLLAVLALILSPKRLWQLIRSVLTPVFAVFGMAGRKDLSKWEHTRI